MIAWLKLGFAMGKGYSVRQTQSQPRAHQAESVHQLLRKAGEGHGLQQTLCILLPRPVQRPGQCSHHLKTFILSWHLLIKRCRLWVSP